MAMRLFDKDKEENIMKLKIFELYVKNIKNNYFLD